MKKKHLTKKQLIRLYIMLFIAVTFLTFTAIHIFLLRDYFVLKLFFSANLAAFILFGFDKTMSTYENAPRLPELFFQIISLAGGSVGIIIGSQVFRHKTRKLSFMWKIYAILFGQMFVLGYIYRDLLGF